MMEMSANYIGAGVQADCEMFLSFLDKDGDDSSVVTLKTFQDTWKQLRFQNIYYGCNSFAEQLEFSEEVLAIAKMLWIESNPLPKQVSRFFLLAALYIKQPFVNPYPSVKIRLSDDELKELEQFYNACELAKFHEVGLVLELMYFNSAFSMSVTCHEYGLESRNKIDRDGDMISNCSSDLNVKELFEDNGLYDELSLSFTQYHQMKCGLSSDGGEAYLPDELSFVNKNTCQELRSIAFPDTASSMGNRSATDMEDESIRQRRSNIKNRAFKKKGKRN